MSKCQTCQNWSEVDFSKKYNMGNVSTDLFLQFYMYWKCHSVSNRHTVVLLILVLDVPFWSLIVTKKRTVKCCDQKRLCLMCAHPVLQTVLPCFLYFMDSRGFKNEGQRQLNLPSISKDSSCISRYQFCLFHILQKISDINFKILMEDSKAFRADCGWADIYGIYAAISSQTNIQMFMFIKFENFSNRISLWNLKRLHWVVKDKK